MKGIENKQQAIVSSDLVSRQAVIKELHDMYRHCVTLEDWHINGADAIYRIEHMPSAQPEPQWIPCNPETNPKKDGWYCATIDGEICGEDEPFVGVAYFENGKWEEDKPDYKVYSCMETA